MTEIVSQWSAWLAAWACRALLLSLVVWVAVWGSRKASVQGRHRMVLWSLVGLLGLPLAILWMPKLPVDWWSGSSANARAAGGDLELGAVLVATAGIVWMVGCGFHLLRLGLAAWAVMDWKRRARPWTGWRSAAMHGRKIFLCEEVDRPVAVGVWRPVVLLPVAAQSWGRRRLQIVWLHEQAHIDRRDLWMQWLGRIVAAVYWFHPLVWWLSRQLIELREMATDERVVEQLGGDGRAYALELVRLAEESAASKTFEREARFLTAAAMAGDSRSALERRVRCLLSVSSGGAKGRGISLLASAGMVGVMLLVACCVPAGKTPSVWNEAEVQLRLTADPFPVR